MTDSYKAMASNIEKFDGTNWATWSFGIRAALTLTNSWNLAVGTETRPPAPEANATAAEVTSRETEQRDWDRHDMQGRSLLVLTVKPSIYQLIDLAETLAQNWTRLSTTYRQRTKHLG